MGTLVAALVSYRVEQLCGLIAVHGETAVNKSTQWEETSASWKGLVLSGPAIVPDPKAAPPILIAVVKLVSKIAPKFAAVKLDAAGICSDPKVNQPTVLVGSTTTNKNIISINPPNTHTTQPAFTTTHTHINISYVFLCF
eukprot:c12310_g1_i1.p2 GENE.c12310_g1_i1~~c12310_g1_i1.p2  ORF type:complete len:140 (+),score=28.69 c12310_g1_i1:538-957(+)